MTTIRFQEVTRRAQRRVKCAGGCGKTLTHRRTFEQTINPFNKNADGQPKTWKEIQAELKGEADAWSPTATCPACIERIEGPKPPEPQYVLVRTGPGDTEVVRADTVAEAREKVAEHLRLEIAEIEGRLAATDQWTFQHYLWSKGKKCKHDGPCFPAEDTPAVSA